MTNATLLPQDSIVTRPSARRMALRACAAAAALLLVSACGATVTKHGHQLRATDVQLIQPGMGEDEVRVALGTPATKSRSPNGSAYYYISSTMSQTSFFKPKEIDRKVLAVYFSPVGTVDRVANYGLKDGKVFDYATNTTPSANTNDDTILKMLFRNLGKGVGPIQSGS
ncbi:MAG: outer membrane protein assembly factor BamE [Pseudomonadota bacterium]